jgi:hypothetical protein
MSGAPIPFAWDGEAMRPLAAFSAAAAERFVVGAVVVLTQAEPRSSPTHRHYFACVREAWANLPEGLAERFATEEHLRKYALIRAGYRNERSIVCSSPAEACRIAGFVEPIDDYSIITVSDAVVTQFAAKSQSGPAMNKAEFQASKEAVLGILAEIIGVERAALVRAPLRGAI